MNLNFLIMRLSEKDRKAIYEKRVGECTQRELLSVVGFDAEDYHRFGKDAQAYRDALVERYAKLIDETGIFEALAGLSDSFAAVTESIQKVKNVNMYATWLTAEPEPETT